MQKFSKWLIKEAISATAVDSVNKIVKSFLAKKLGTKVYNYPGVEEFTNSTGRGYGVRYFYQDKSIRFNWKGANVNAFTLDSVDLWDGTSRDPNWHLEFDAQQSLVKTLPLIINFIQSPFGSGTFYLIPDDSKSTKTVKEEYLIEAQQIDAFDFVIKNLKPGAEISSTSLTAEFGSYKPYPVLKAIQNLYPQLFSKSGRKQVFSGTADDVAKIKSQKDGIIGSIGGVKIEVSKGGRKETYAPSEQESEIEAKGIEKVAYEEQLKHLSVLMRMVIKGATNALFIAGRGGTGKSLPSDTPVLMSDKTWKKISDIQVGDMVTSWDGTPTPVIGVYPQGLRPIQTITFSDGRQIECDNEHLWEVNHHSWNSHKVLTTLEIKRLIEKGLDSRVHIPLFSDAYFEDRDLPLDPWLLGFLIGDGALTNRTTCFSTKDLYIVEKVKDLLEEGYDIGLRENGVDYIIKKTSGLGTSECNIYTDAIKRMGLNVTSSDKFIPEVYKSASKRQKVELVRGLLDSDGYVDKNGSVTFTSTSERLVDDLREIIWSIGGKCKKSGPHKSRYFSHKQNDYVECKDHFNLLIQHPNQYDLVTLPRKKERMKEFNQYSSVGLSINEITGSSPKECICIKIEDDRGLFVVKDYIVTHNTQTVEAELAKAGLQDGNGYYKNTGSASPIGIYTSLYDNKNGIVLFDDCDSALADQEGRNLIKAATDTKKIRKVAWNKKSSVIVPRDQFEDAESDDGVPTNKHGDPLYPNSFEFTGRIIFISNLKMDKLDPDGAIRTRGFIIEIDPTDAEMIDYMAKIAPNIRLEGGVTLKQSEIDDVIAEIRKSPKKSDISLRKLVRGLNVKAEMGNDPMWKTILKLYA